MADVQLGAQLTHRAPAALSMPDDVQQEVAARGIEQRCTEVLDEVLAGSDVLYVTRVQKERFESVEEYERLKHAFVITPDTLRRVRCAAASAPLPANGLSCVNAGQAEDDCHASPATRGGDFGGGGCCCAHHSRIATPGRHNVRLCCRWTLTPARHTFAK